MSCYIYIFVNGVHVLLLGYMWCKLVVFKCESTSAIYVNRKACAN